MGTLSFDLICNRAEGGGDGEDARARGFGRTFRVTVRHREQLRVRGVETRPRPSASPGSGGPDASRALVLPRKKARGW